MAGVVIRDMFADAEFATQLEQAHLDDLSALMLQASNATLAYAAQNASGTCTAGIKGSTSYGWLKTGLHWVHPAQRQRRQGRGLLYAAMSAAKARAVMPAGLKPRTLTRVNFTKGLGSCDWGNWVIWTGRLRRTTVAGSCTGDLGPWTQHDWT